MRTETEWVELTHHGVNKLIGNDIDQLKTYLPWALQLEPELFEEPLYGDGNASEHIVNEIRKFLDQS